MSIGVLTFFVIFTCFVFIVNFILIARAYLTFKKDEVIDDSFKPSVSIIVPAFNEEVNIVESINSMLKQDYDNFNIIVVNDGSTDSTSEKVMTAFNLIEAIECKDDLKIKDHKNFKEVDSVYYGNKIILINKKNGGKADALNAGFCYTDAEWILSVDGDTLLEPNCLKTLTSKRKEDVDAIASMVGICNDNEIVEGRVVSRNVPKNFWAKVQWMEYNRSYMLLRNSLKDCNIVTVIPGACSFVSSKMIEKTRGYKHDHLGEDMEHTLNIHKQKGKIQFLSEVLSWTEAPNNVRDLGKQRVRWFRGALQSYSKYTSLLFKKENKALSWFLIPFIWVADIFGGWIELLGWVVAIFTIVTSSYDYTFFIILWIFIVLLHYINFLMGLNFIKKKLHVANSYRGILFVAFIEGFTYHYLYVYWLLKAHILEIFRIKRNWNKLDRKGFV